MAQRVQCHSEMLKMGHKVPSLLPDISKEIFWINAKMHKLYNSVVCVCVCVGVCLCVCVCCLSCIGGLDEVQMGAREMFKLCIHDAPSAVFPTAQTLLFKLF